MPLTRRLFLAAALATAGCAYTGPDRTVRVAAGEPGGFYVEFARLLAAELADAYPSTRASVVETLGSVMNIAKVGAGEADLGLVLVDAMTAAQDGAPPFPRATRLPALGRVYENYMQLVVPARSRYRTLADLAGRRVSLGATGSGAALFGTRMLDAAGVSVEVDHHPLAEAAEALRTGGVEALLWSGGLPTPALTDLDDAIGIRLLDLEVTELRRRHGAVYDRVTIPSGTYRDAGEVTTVGVPNLLVASPAVPADVVEATVRVLVQRAGDLVPRQALGTQYLDVRSLIDTAPVPLHPRAAEAYRELRG
ncbi:TAXI family TRAP transporter solute-binding subunit [Actinokineospora auranticolor]|uniref:TRAP transporter TAXI family solute receptor n=1 Tax=Actinokineospora auranticolor TaxID=155976 RepID=A0A2S6GTE1_9PSEU|nr:TAXI family TRAP transporter solute-binding subunit [Actinokineospora auranticolor]PPK68391.1 hypothetical protein CLV40_105114 [Actinokineospora auranticolor]